MGKPHVYLDQDAAEALENFRAEWKAKYGAPVTKQHAVSLLITTHPRVPSAQTMAPLRRLEKIDGLERPAAKKETR